jgi:hypothetical protein
MSEDILYETAQLIVCCWLLGPNTDLPTSHGVLDRALYQAKEKGALPEWAWKDLHFVDSRIGFQCVELPAILNWAQSAELTSAPNPSYSVAELKITERVAKRLLAGLDVSEEQARALGSILGVAVAEAEATDNEFHSLGIA